MNPIQIGQVLFNQFRVEAFIASGGMGAVYRVWDMQRNAPLAMKVLHADLADDPAVFKRFQREARALQKLTHPNIVPFYGLYHLEDIAFILESYIDGPSLKDVLRQTKGEGLPIPQALSYLKAISAALGYAHSNGVVHCDVKPGNVMIDRGGTIYLTDFGVARHAESTTTTIGSAGTPAYMAPEQIRGEAVSPATDIYGLGVLLFEMLTGQRPFRGSEAGTESAGVTAAERTRYGHLYLQAPDPRSLNADIPASLAHVVLSALNKEPTKRFTNTQALFLAACSAASISPAEVIERVSPSDMPFWTAPIPVSEKVEPAPSWMERPAVSEVANTVPGTTGNGSIAQAPVIEKRPKLNAALALVGAVGLGVLVIVVGFSLISSRQNQQTPLSTAPVAVETTLPTPRTNEGAVVPTGMPTDETAVIEVTPTLQGEEDLLVTAVPLPSLTVTATPLPSQTATPSPTPQAAGEPPGGMIVYTCQLNRNADANQICVMNSDGSGYRQLTRESDNIYASFAPDNQSVVFISKLYGSEDILEADLQGNLTRITRGDGPWTAPHISPDGSLILAARKVNQHWELWTMNRDGSDKRYVYTPNSGSGAWDPVWSPDGSSILFASDMNGTTQLYTISKSGFDLQQASNLDNLRGRSDWSPDNIYLATYGGVAWEREIYLMGLDGSNARAITYGGNNLAPSFSPDGQWIVFTSYRDRYRDDNGCEIYILSITSAEILRLTDNDYCDWQPRWSR